MSEPVESLPRRKFNAQLAETLFRYARQIRLKCGDLLQAQRLEERARELEPR